jgi:autotransporter-associated beta strand protein
MSLTDGSTTNWTTDAAGASASAVVPGDAATNVIFSATGATQHSTISASGSMDLGSLTFNDGTAVTIASPYSITLNNTSGTAATTTAARATITNAGPDAISAISVTSFANGTNTINAPIILGANQTWNVANNKTLTVSGEVSGDSSLTKADAGTVVLSAFPTYTGTTTINGGKLQINAGGLSSVDTISLNADGATLQFGSNGSPGVSGEGGAYISNPIVVGSSVTSTGARLWVNGNQGGWRFTGSITGAGSGAQTLLFDNRAGLTTGGDRNTTTFSGVISDGTNGGNLGLSFVINPQTANNTHPSYVNLTAANTFTGDITASRTVGGSTSWLTIGGEKWSDGPNNTPTYGKEGSGYLGANNGGNYTGNIRFGSANLLNLAYYSSANQTLSGTIGGASANNGALVMDGSGTLTLSGTNTYTGTTTVNNGKLIINGDQTSATGAVSVSANATLGGKGIIGGNTTIADSGKLEFNLNTAPGSHDKLEIEASKTFTFSGASTLTLASLSGASTGPYTLISAPGGISGSVPATVVLPVGWTADAPTISGGTDLVINITSTGSPASPFETWADGTFANGTLTDKTPGGDEEGDGLTNLREFAFGTDPTVNFTGVLEYVNGGAVTTPGQPVLLEDGGTYYAVFGRRTTYVTDGLTYNVQFSADLSSPWVTSGATPTILATSGGIEAVSVPFPGLIITDSGPQKARFFRVVVSLAP